jgi:hypothetical protein
MKSSRRVRPLFVVCTILLALAAVSWRSLRVQAQIDRHPILLEESVTLYGPCIGLTVPFPCWLTKKGATVVDPNLANDPNIVEANQYYRSIDAFGNVPTLAAFQIENQFTLSNGQPRNVGLQSFYFNDGDLQLGREMHCNQQPHRSACYVSNYGPPPFPPGTLDNNQAYPSSSQAISELESVAFNTAMTGPVPFATVAMESLEDPPPTTNVSVSESAGVTSNPSPPKNCWADYSGNLPPTNADVDTGLDIESGDLLTFQATGSIWLGYCFTGRSSPDGLAGLGNSDYPLESAHDGELIGTVGQPGVSYFEIGSGAGTDTHPIEYTGRPGRLFLRTNDNNPGNGSGSFAVNVTITRNKVRFYVYVPAKDKNGNVSADPGKTVLLPYAALDKEGNKTFPQMCMACHGGTYDDSHHQAVNASFLPFDVFSFLYSNKPGLRLQDQEEQFRQLNLLVKNTNPNPTDQNKPIQTLIDTVYGGNAATPGTVADATKTPSGWIAHNALYHEFVAHYCRTCHSASSTFDFSSYDEFKQAASASDVCGSEIMPHAQVPFTALSGAKMSSAAAADLHALGYSCLKEPFIPIRLSPLQPPH